MISIKLAYRKKFGRILYYPNCIVSKTIARITNVKSFTQEQLNIMKKAHWAIDITGWKPED